MVNGRPEARSQDVVPTLDRLTTPDSRLPPISPALDSIQTHVLYMCFTKMKKTLLVLVVAAAGACFYVYSAAQGARAHRHRHDQRHRRRPADRRPHRGAPRQGRRHGHQGQIIAVISPDELARRERLLRAQRRGHRVADPAERGGAALPGAADGRADHAGRGDHGATEAQQAAAAAELERAQASRSSGRRAWRRKAVAPAQQLDTARTSYDAAVARLDALKRQADAAARGDCARAHQRRAGRRCAAARCRPTSTSRRPRRAQQAEGGRAPRLHAR